MSEQAFPDPRPQIGPGPDGELCLLGWSCTACRHALALSAPWCPRCRGRLEPARFGPAGTVWSSTVLRVPLPGREPPSVLAYVDIDGGPRVLAHVAGSNTRLHVGDGVALAPPTDLGDLLVRPIPTGISK